MMSSAAMTCAADCKRSGSSLMINVVNDNVSCGR